MIKAVSIVGESGTGKTQLICELLSWFAGRGRRVAVLKHSHKTVLGDEAKDTGRFRLAGASLIALATPVLVQITKVTAAETPLEEMLQTLGQGVDLVLVEGWKAGHLPKVAVLSRNPEPTPPRYPHLIAVVSQQPLDIGLPVFQPEDTNRLGQFLLDYFKLA